MIRVLGVQPDFTDPLACLFSSTVSNLSSSWLIFSLNSPGRSRQCSRTHCPLSWSRHGRQVAGHLHAKREEKDIGKLINNFVTGKRRQKFPELLLTERNRARILLAWATNHAQPGWDQTVKFPESFHNDDFGCWHADTARNAHYFFKRAFDLDDRIGLVACSADCSLGLILIPVGSRAWSQSKMMM